VPQEDLVTTSQLARALGVSLSSIKRYVAAGQITPDLTTPGGHHRWNVENVRRQLREVQQRMKDDADG
jgi:DNA-binding transcriptional MerR regulator